MSEAVESDGGYVLQDLHNLRDLGGLSTQDGHVVRHGVLIRSDSPHEASAADIGHLVSRLRVSTVIDLRSEKEFVADGTNALMPSSVRHRHFPIAAGPGGAIDGAPAGDRLAARYMQYLDDDTASIVGAIRAVSEATDGAAVVHCRVGKDRTGIVIALILDALGVSVADIASDYHLTAEPMRKLLERLKASPVYAANVARLPDEMYSSEPETMVSFLDRLHADHGGAAKWLLSHGLSSSELDSLRRHLLEGDAGPTSEGTPA